MSVTTVLVLDQPSTLADLIEFCEKAKDLTDAELSAPVKVFGKTLRIVWPLNTGVSENLTKSIEMDE